MRDCKHILGRFLAYLLLCVIAITALSSCGVKAAELDNTVQPMEASDKNMTTESIINPDTEIRAVWIASVFNIDYPSKTDLTAAQLQAELDEIVATCVKNKLNTIFFQVRPTCDALYKSEIFPVSSYLSTSGTLPFDPLAYLVQTAHEHNIFVHAWVNPLRVTMNSTDISTLPTNSPARQHPEWTVPFADGKLYLNAGLPEVRQLVADGVREIVSNYAVDGIVFDDYFYPYPAKNEDGTAATFDDAAAYAAYGSEYSDIADWRRANINATIRAVYETIKAVDKDCQFGVAPFGIWQNDDGQNGGSATNGFEAYKSLYSDALAWVNGGYIDYLSPQLYWRFSDTAAAYDILLHWWNTKLDNTGVDLIVSHAVYRYEDGNWDSPQGEMTEQVSYARSEISYKGSAFYGYDEIHKNTNGASDDIIAAYQSDILYPKIQSNGLKPGVNSPVDGATMNVSTTYLLGTSDPAYPLYLNGEKIGRTKSGYFSTMVTLKEGENKFTFTQNGEDTIYTLYYQPATASTAAQSSITVLDSVKIIGVYPSNAITTDKTAQWVSCVAPYGAKVTATLSNGTSVALSMTETPSVTKTDGGYVGVIYGGSVPLPSVTDTETKNAGTITIAATLGQNTVSATTATIRVKGKNTQLAIRVKEDYAALKFSETSSYYNDYTVQSIGMTDMVKAQKNGFYELSMGGFIAEKYVDEITDNLPAASGYAITGAEVKNAGTNTELRFHTGNSGDTGPAYYGKVEDGKFIVTLYSIDTTKVPDSVPIGENPLFSACEIVKMADSGKVRFLFTLKNERNFYGFDLYYKDGWTVVTCRNPMKIDLTREKPLDGVRIVLDAGHGGDDNGARGFSTSDEKVLNEKQLNLAIVMDAAEKLKALGANVSLIRTDDTTVSLYARMAYLEAAEPDLSISIHQNSMGYTTDITRVRGVLPLYCADSGKLLADCVGGEVGRATGRYTRTSQYQMLALCRNPKFPQTLIEVGFITNMEEYEQMAVGRGITQAADGVVNGVLRYFREMAAFAS